MWGIVGRMGGAQGRIRGDGDAYMVECEYMNQVKFV